MKGSQTWTPQEENGEERRESFILKQTHLNVKNDNAMALKYIDFRSSAVQQFQKVKIA
jgi:hypothetical protein